MPDDAVLRELKTAIEEQNRAWEEFKATNDASLKTKADTGVVEEKLQKLNKAMDDAAEKQRKAEERLAAAEKKAADAEKKAARPGGFDTASGAPAYSDDQIEHRAAFTDWLRKGTDKGDLHALEKKAMSVGNDAEGGYFAPKQMLDRMTEVLRETSPLRTLASVITTGNQAVTFPTDINDATSGGWVSEKGSRPATNTPAVGQQTIETHEQYANPGVTQQLLEDGAFDVEAWLNRKWSDKIARVENTAFVTGDGNGKPRGFTSYTTAATADDSRAWGQLEHIKSGANGAFASSNPADVLFDLVAAFKSGYLAGPGVSWVTNRAVLGAIRKFKGTDNQYLWQPGLQQGQPQRLLDFGILIAQDMPALATNSLSLALGNFAQGYLIVDRIGLAVLRDPYTNKPFVQFYMRKRVGGDVVNFETIKFIKFAS